MGSWDDRHFYNDASYATLAEARWAAFFEAMKHHALYDEHSDWAIGNEDHYTPQFWVRSPSGSFYLEVAERWNQNTRKYMRYDHPEIQEHRIYLAIGDLPPSQRVRLEGWWYERRKRTVMRLTPGPKWNDLYPSTDKTVLDALDRAHAADISPAVPFGRREDEGGTAVPLWDPLDD